MSRILKMLFLVVLQWIMVTNVTNGLPDRWNPSRNVSYYDSKKSSPDHDYTLRKMSKRNYANEDDVSGRSDGKIVFPSEDIDPLPSRSQFESSLERMCENLTFCENPVNYPSDLAEAALKENKEILKFYSGADFVPDVTHRLNNLHEEYMSFCDSYEKVVYPRVAQGKDDEWFYIANWGDFRQGVRVEICANENKACDVINGFAEGYQVVCKQDYIYRQLLTITDDAKLEPQQFRLPSSCSCLGKFTGNLLQRMRAARTKTAHKIH